MLPPPDGRDPAPDVERIMHSLFSVPDMADLELFRRLKGVAHLVSLLSGSYSQEGSLSSARMRLLVRLVVALRLGSSEGLSPSELSDFLGVSRNTVSALINGLEEQALVERHVHPTDRRQFLIRITPAGQERVQSHAPAFAAFVSSLFAGLSGEERAALLALLDKLLHGLVERAAALGLEPRCAAAAGALVEEEASAQGETP